MPIIVEGCDNTGKTTLITQLVAKFHPNLHAVKSPGPGNGLGSWCIDELGKDDPYAVYDRFFFSEKVYGPILRGKVCFNTAQDATIEQLMCLRKPAIIWCSRPLKRIAESFYDREQLPDASNIPEIEESYYHVMLGFFNRTKLPYFMSYDYEKEGKLDAVIKMIQKYLLDRTGFADRLQVTQ